jgi:hypothetical protein
VQELPDFISSATMFYWLTFESVYLSGMFEIYDPELSKRLDQFAKAWAHTLSFSEEFTPLNDGYKCTFSKPATSREELRYKKLNLARQELSDAIGNLRSYVREKYLEVDIHETTRMAWKEYVNHKKHISRILSTTKHTHKQS